jgi:hypothetical protein
MIRAYCFSLFVACGLLKALEGRFSGCSNKITIPASAEASALNAPAAGSAPGLLRRKRSSQ